VILRYFASAIRSGPASRAASKTRDKLRIGWQDQAEGDGMTSEESAQSRFDPPSGPVSYYLDYLGVKRSQ
jgi:hypothetical protein